MASYERNTSNASQHMSSVATPLFQAGCSFVDSLGVKPGDKVLDMGCGTGEITRYLAEKVGKNGQVVGVDPDVEIIKVARDNTASFLNVTVEVGDSGSAFLHHNKPYYDFHFSNHVFHWLDHKERQMYIKKAYECLKSDGLLAIQCLTKPSDDIVNQLTDHFNSMRSVVSKVTIEEQGQVTHELLVVDCKFTNLEITFVPAGSCTYFDTFDDIAACWVATAYYTDLNKKLLADIKKEMTKADGHLKSIYKKIQVKARKSTTPIEQSC